jgi:hypothetical protein
MFISHIIACGYGKFPVEMLAKENCYPKETDDAIIIAETFVKNDHWKVKLYKIGDGWQTNEWNKRGAYLVFDIPASKPDPEDFVGIPKDKSDDGCSPKKPYWVGNNDPEAFYKWLDEVQPKAKELKDKFYKEVLGKTEELFNSSENFLKEVFENFEKNIRKFKEK